MPAGAGPFSQIQPARLPRLLATPGPAKFHPVGPPLVSGFDLKLGLELVKHEA